jgi:hypothetical protein
LYAGAISRGRSGRTESTDGVAGANVSLGHPAAAELNVGVVYSAVFVVEGYTGIMYSLFVAVANIPAASFALAELAAAEEAAAVLDDDEELFFRAPRIPPTTAATMTRTARGTPILIHLLVPLGFTGLAGVMYPVEWVYAGSSFWYTWC